MPLATQALLAREPWQIGALFFLLMAVAMLPAAFLAGGADRIPGHSTATTSLREVLGQAMRNRPFLVMSGAYFVCGLNLVFLSTHLPAYLAICGQDPMLGAEALAVIGGASAIGSLLTAGSAEITRSTSSSAPLHPAVDHDRHLFRAAAHSDQHAPVRCGDGDAVVARPGAANRRVGRRHLRHSIHCDPARLPSFVVHQAGSSLGAWGGGHNLRPYGSYDHAWQIGTLIGFAAGVVQILAGVQPGGRSHDRTAPRRRNSRRLF